MAQRSIDEADKANHAQRASEHTAFFGTFSRTPIQARIIKAVPTGGQEKIVLTDVERAFDEGLNSAFLWVERCRWTDGTSVKMP